MRSTPMSKGNAPSAVATLLRSHTACPCARRSLSRTTNWMSITCPRTRPHASLPVASHTCIRACQHGVVWLVLIRLDLSRLASSTFVSRFVSHQMCQQTCRGCGAQFPIYTIPLAGGRAWTVRRPLKRIFMCFFTLVPISFELFGHSRNDKDTTLTGF